MVPVAIIAYDEDLSRICFVSCVNLEEDVTVTPDTLSSSSLLPISFIGSFRFDIILVTTETKSKQ